MNTRDQHSKYNQLNSKLPVQSSLSGASSESSPEETGNRRRERIKTRHLSQLDPGMPTPEQTMERHKRFACSGDIDPLGLIAIIEGPGRGEFFDLPVGFTRIGRGETQEIRLSGDHFISNENHAIIGYVPERKVFFIFDGGKENPVWVNDKMVSDVSSLKNEDNIRIGKTTLLFMAF